MNNKNKNNNTNNLYIFNKNINNSKLIPFKERKLFLGEVKYYPPVSKEWKNTIYVFNYNSLKNLPVYDININRLINSYFNAYFYYKFIHNKYKPRSKKRLSKNKIYLSKAEIKHTNSKAILTLYIFNREKIALLKKMKWLKKSFYVKLYKIIKILINKNNKNLKIFAPNLYIKMFKSIFFKELALFRRYKMRLNLNNYKFEEKLIYNFTSLIHKYYKKKVEFNIINLKSIILNSDLFTKILTLKLRKKTASIMRMMKIILNKAVLPKVNRILEKSYEGKYVDFSLLENIYKDLHLNSILKEKSNLDELLNKIYNNILIEKNNNNNNNNNNKSNTLQYKLYEKFYELIFNSIKYKNMGGVRLEVKGRLTKRYRADRALYKVRWKGGLKNIDSSYKGRSSINIRGYRKPNVEYSIFTSKRRVGAYAVKGWISGK